jgi:hypothetical protein
LHNFCIWFNLHVGRAPLAKARVAGLVDPFGQFTPNV